MSTSQSFIRKIAVLLEAIKFEHTVFALPFALTAAVLAGGFPPIRVLGWILLAMVGARSAAMAFNRIVDLRFDKLNPRTKGRALPAGALKLAEMWAFTIVAAGVLIYAAYRLNPLAFYLSPVALLVVMGYSYTKRFTSLSHLVLGLALGIAPTAAWIGVTGRIDLAPVALSAVVMFWTAGFDIIYAMQDVEFDRKLGLFSIPAKVGPSKALSISRVFHAAAVLLLFAFGLMLKLGAVYYVGVAFVAGLLIYEQSLVKPDDLSKVDMAFFNTNGFVSIGYFLFALVDAFIRKAL